MCSIISREYGGKGIEGKKEFARSQERTEGVRTRGSSMFPSFEDTHEQAETFLLRVNEKKREIYKIKLKCSEQLIFLDSKR